MILLLHIMIAISSIGIATVAYFKPSVKKLGASYGFIIATVASGTALLIMNPSNILHTCLSGLFYVTVVSIVTIATHVRAGRLGALQIENDN